MSLHDIWRGDVMPLSGVAVSIGRNTFDPPAPTVPVFDIHARSLELHDSGNNSSGILRYNGTGPAPGERLELIPSNSGTQPIVTAVLFDAYDSTGGTVVNTSLTILDISTERINTHPDIFVLNASSGVQINRAGTYVLEYRYSFDTAHATVRSTGRTYLERSVAGGAFAEVAGTRSYSYHRIAANGEASAAAKVILDVAVGDTFRLRGISIGVIISQLANGTSLTIRKLK